MSMQTSRKHQIDDGFYEMWLIATVGVTDRVIKKRFYRIIVLGKTRVKNYSSALSVKTIEPEIRDILIFIFIPGFELATYIM